MATGGTGSYEVLMRGVKGIRSTAVAAIKNTPIQYKIPVIVVASLAIAATGIILFLFDREEKS
jgi:hypothetical protein